MHDKVVFAVAGCDPQAGGVRKGRLLLLIQRRKAAKGVKNLRAVRRHSRILNRQPGVEVLCSNSFVL